MQFSIEGVSQTSMKAIIVLKGHLSDVELLMRKIQSSLPPGEVAEIANINNRTQASFSLLFYVCTL